MLSVKTIARVEVNVVRSASVPASFDTGLLLVKDSSFAASKRLKSYANSAEAAAGLVADGFSSSTEAYKAAQKYFAASPAPGRLLVSCYPTSESPVQALDAVLDSTSDFYGIALADSRTDAELLALDTHIAGLDKPCMLFLPLIGTPAAVVAANSLLDQLHNANSKRTVATFAAAVSDASAVMGAAMGLQPVLQGGGRHSTFQPDAVPGGRHPGSGRKRIRHPGVYAYPSRKGKHSLRLALR